MRVSIKANGAPITMKCEVSVDGKTWAAVIGDGVPMLGQVEMFPFARPWLPEGWHWCSVHAEDGSVQYVAMPD